MKKISASLLITALFVASLNLRFALNSISPILKVIQDSLHMNASMASLLISIPVLCMGIFSPIAAKLGNRWGMERVILVSITLIGIGTILRFVTSSTFFLLVTAFIAGVGIAAAGPLLSGFIKRYFSNKAPVMISVYTVALTIGASLASGLSTSLQTMFHSWQSALGIWSIFAFIAVPVWVILIRRVENKSNVPSIHQSKTTLPWANPKAWLLTFSFGLMSMIFYSVTAWLPPIIESFGYSKLYAANSLTLFVAIQIPVCLLVPILLKKAPSRLLWLQIAAMSECIGFLMIFFSIEPWIASIFISIGAGALFPLNLLLPIDVTTSAEEATSWASMIQSVGYVIGATGPFILGWIFDAGASFTSAVVGMIGITLCMIVIHLNTLGRKRSNRMTSEPIR